MAGMYMRVGITAFSKEGGSTKIHPDSATEHKSRAICFKRSSKQSAKSLHFSESARSRNRNPLGFCDSPRMGQQHISPGQSAAPPWVLCPPMRDRPEGAKLVGIGRMCRNRLFGPFRAMGVARGCVPRAALRFALGCYV